MNKRQDDWFGNRLELCFIKELLPGKEKAGSCPHRQKKALPASTAKRASVSSELHYTSRLSSLVHPQGFEPWTH